jgi:hypothetical protein
MVAMFRNVDTSKEQANETVSLNFIYFQDYLLHIMKGIAIISDCQNCQFTV